MSRTTDGRALILYGTLGCHLCEEALALALPVARRLDVVLEERDIAIEPALEARYGNRIPVLRRCDGGAELDWPFDTAAIYRLLL